MLRIKRAICASGWRRGLFGKGFRSPTGRQTIFSVSPGGGCALRACFGGAGWAALVGDVGAISCRARCPISAGSVRCFMPAIVGSRGVAQFTKLLASGGRADLGSANDGQHTPASQNKPPAQGYPCRGCGPAAVLPAGRAAAPALTAAAVPPLRP